MTAGKLGDSDGTIGTTRYFECAVNEGLFVRLNEIQRRIEPKELLEKVVKLTKIKNSMHELLNESNHELRKLKKKLNLSSICSRKVTPKHSKKRGKMPSLYDENSGSTTTATYEASMSGDSISMYNPENSMYSKYSSFRKANHLYSNDKAVETSKWDSEQVIQWIESFAVGDDALWIKLIEQIRQHQVNGNDLLHMNETHLVSQRLGIDSSQIEDTLMHELRQCKQTSIPSLKESSSSLVQLQAEDMKESNTRSFHQLHLYFDKIDHANKGQIDYDSFRFVLIEMNPDLEPYKLNNQAIRKCFKEFDLTNNGFITIEEFIVVMGKTYLRALYKKSLTRHDIKTFFIQIIKHFIKKGQKNINYKKKKKKKTPLSRHKSLSRSRTESDTKGPPPRPPPRRGSVSRSRTRPPPPKREPS
eukprot:52865_1